MTGVTGDVGGCDFGFWRARSGSGCFQGGVHVDGETATGVIADPCPGLQDVRGGDQRHRRLVQELPPLHEILVGVNDMLACEDLTQRRKGRKESLDFVGNRH